MRLRMVIVVLIAILLLAIIMLLLGAALLLSTGNPPEGESSGVQGIIYSVEVFLAGVIEDGIEWVDYLVHQVARVVGAL